jgi:hypothetical protein
MTNDDVLYNELEPDIGLVVEKLFDLSEALLHKRGNFLPHAVVLTEDSEIRLVGSAPETNNDQTDSTEVLPVLRAGLRAEAKEIPLKAIGIAENVTISPEGGRTTDAIKVLFEHKRGLCLAMYLPFKKKLFRGYSFGSSFAVSANPEVSAWEQDA